MLLKSLIWNSTDAHLAMFMSIIRQPVLYIWGILKRIGLRTELRKVRVLWSSEEIGRSEKSRFDKKLKQKEEWGYKLVMLLTPGVAGPLSRQSVTSRRSRAQGVMLCFHFVSWYTFMLEFCLCWSTYLFHRLWVSLNSLNPALHKPARYHA